MSENESNRQRERDDGGSAGAGSSNENKRIRLSDPDLQITCKDGDKERTLEYHSIQMALQSKYFDNLLSSGMAESATKKVVLNDVDPDLFAEAMSLIESPAKFADAHITKVMKVASLYDRFEFKNGLESVDMSAGKVLHTLRMKLSKKFAISAKELDHAISIILFGDTANSSFLVTQGKKLIGECFKSQGLNGLGCFDERRVKALQPFLCKNRQLLEMVHPEMTKLDDEDIKSRNFPKFLSCHFDLQINKNYFLEIPLTLQVRVSIPAQDNGHPGVENSTFLLKPTVVPPDVSLPILCGKVNYRSVNGDFQFVQVLPKPAAKTHPEKYFAGMWVAKFRAADGDEYLLRHMSQSTKKYYSTRRMSVAYYKIERRREPRERLS